MFTEKITAGITHDWFDNNPTHIYTITSLSVSSLSMWNESIMGLLNSIKPTQRQLLLCYDLSAGQVSVPYLIFNNYKIDNIAVVPSYKPVVDTALVHHPDLIIGLALVIANSATGKVALKRGQQSATPGPQVHFNTFFDREAAIEWLYTLDVAKEA